MEQRIFFQGHSPPTPPVDYIILSWNFVNSCTVMWSSAYYFKVAVHQIVAELCPFENFCKCFVSC